jgi:hypothetical protein
MPGGMRALYRGDRDLEPRVAEVRSRRWNSVVPERRVWDRPACSGTSTLRRTAGSWRYFLPECVGRHGRNHVTSSISFFDETHLFVKRPAPTSEPAEPFRICR